MRLSRFRLTANPHEPNLDHKKKGSHHHTMGPFIAFICIYIKFILRKHQTWLAFFNPRTSHGRYGKIRIFSPNWWIFPIFSSFQRVSLEDTYRRLRDHATHADSNDVHLLLMTESGDVLKETGDSTNAGSAVNIYVHIFSTYHI